jgi:Cof subfamily protein (haloacid dehalogenase superfamily)
MNRFKMLALDIDGTILNSRGEISPRVRAAVARAMHAGMLVTLATGRNLRAALPIAEELGITAPLVVNNGALVIAPASGQVLLHRPLTNAAAVTAVQLLLRMGFTVYASRGTLEGPDLFFEQPPAVPEQCCLLGRDPRFAVQVYDLAGAVSAMETLKVMILDRTASVEAAARRLAGTMASGFRVLVTPEGDGYALLEVSAPEISKATGLERLTALNGISPDEVIAMGDNLNDLEMLQWVGMGVAMGNAAAMVKQVARAVTASNDDDGVALFLEQHVFRVA